MNSGAELVSPAPTTITRLGAASVIVEVIPRYFNCETTDSIITQSHNEEIRHLMSTFWESQEEERNGARLIS
jgi:hypothetical protein